MPFRDKVRKVLQRTSAPKEKTKPKIEYYRHGEVPRSKYRGPVDPEHRRQLHAWNFEDATADRNRSFDLDISPCTSLADDHDCNDDEAMGADAIDEPTIHIGMAQGGSITIAHHEIASLGSVDSSPSSTLVDSESSNSSSLTLKDSWDWPVTEMNPMISLKGTISGTADLIPRQTPDLEKLPPLGTEELTRTLNTLQIC